MASEQTATRRRYSQEMKAQVLAECDVHGVCVLGAQPVDLCAQPRSRCRLEARRRRQIKKVFFLSAVILYASSGMAEPFSSCHPV